ncbi:helix-turn-helix domain-containing protein [Methylobacterium sp. SD21]|uniref:helix-turn-helix domain-containing protein n=1 Tax=Methylobacterium litchii TaxID=3138810 RepID=UPI00313E3DE9
MRDLTIDDVRAALSQAVRDHGSQKAFAALAGINRSQLCEVMSGRREPSARILAALALARVERFVSLRREA